MKRTIYILLLIPLLCIISCKGGKETTGNTPPKGNTGQSGPKSLVNFQNSNSLSAVLEIAKRENKPVFVDFYTTWCTPCKMMDEDVFTDRNLASFVNQNFVSYKVDCETEKGAPLATIFNVYNYPTLVFLDTRGNELVRHNQAAYHSKFLELAEEAIDKYKDAN